MNPLELFDIATYGAKVEVFLKSSTQKLLRGWREEGGTDDEIYRRKLFSCGWRYSRQKGCWIHPKVREYEPPVDLKSLARLMAETILRDALDKKP